jgi:hypothetical protein
VVLLGTPLGNALRTWGISLGSFENMMGELKKLNLCPHLSPRKKDEPFSELVQPSHWLHANSIPKFGCHNFGFELLPLP